MFNLDNLIKMVVTKNNEIIERAVEEAVQGGLHGVKVTWRIDNWAVSAKVDPSVPYGEIHEFREY
jgi:hypothetical protein